MAEVATVSRETARGMIFRSSVDEVAASPVFDELLAEYAAESAIAGMPPPNARLDQYRELEAAGMLAVFSAEHDGELVGFITVLCAPLPHYGRGVAVSESFFVRPRHRHTLAGLRLLTTAERHAASLGSPGLLVSAPYGGKLFEVLPRAGYRETNRVYFKAAAPRAIAPMPPRAIDQARELEAASLAHCPQLPIRTQHVLHAGLYSRTVELPKGTMITGVLIRIATLLIVAGDAKVYVGEDEARTVSGYNVLPASAGRKQAFLALSDVHLTMVFATEAASVEQAEREFTDEFDKLTSHRDGLNEIVITGER